MRKLSRTILTYFTLFLLSVFFSAWVYAFPSSSASYKLDGEFGDFGGQKNSASYTLTDTGGGFVPGLSNSTNYLSCSGFQCQLSQVPAITFSLSTNTVNLGTLTTGAVNTQTHTATVTTNFQGYTLTVVQNGPLTYGSATIAPVSPSPGTISAGTEAYGIATSKASQTITQNSSCSTVGNFSALTTSPQSIAGSTSPTSSSGDTTTLCYGATKSGATAAGTYTQTLTYIATGKF